MYIKNSDSVYKFNLSGFTKKFNNIVNWKEILTENAISGLERDLRRNSEIGKIFEVFDSYSIGENEKNEINILYNRINFLYYLKSSIYYLKEEGYTATIDDENFMGKLADIYIPDDEIEEFMKYYRNTR